MTKAKHARRAALSRSTPKTLVLGLGAALFAAKAGSAHAYDAATTHAGLTQQAVGASHLHQILTARLGRSLGLFDLVRFQGADLSAADQALWRTRFASLDAASGYRPDAESKQTALGWVLAGAVLSHAPADRARLSFLDPSTGRGLAQEAGAAAWGDGVGSVLDQASLRGVATGASARREAPSAWEWVTSPANDEGLPSFEAHLAASVTSPTAAARETALARALLSLGGVLGVLEDLGEPAHVRNDLDRAFLSDGPGQGHAGPFNRGSLYERWVAERYGTSGVPMAATPVVREDAKSFFFAPDGQGLANRTQRRFFSVGTVPDDQPINTASLPRDVSGAAQSSLTYALPAVGPLALSSAKTRYVEALEGERTVKKLAYRLEPGYVRFFLDARVYADNAAALLPEIGGYAAGLVDFLFRASVTLELQEGLVMARVSGAKGSLKGGTLTLLSEDEQGKRTVMGTFADVDAASVPIPQSARRVVAFARGSDQAGTLVAAGTLSLAGPAPTPASQSPASAGSSVPASAPAP